MGQNRLVEVGPDRIVIDDLRVQAYVGVHDFEHAAPQTLRFDIEIDTVSGYLDRTMEDGSYVSYADPVEFIRTKAATGGHVRLVEDWAQSVAAFILENPLVAEARVKVSKPDIFGDAAGAGIRIARRRG